MRRRGPRCCQGKHAIQPRDASGAGRTVRLPINNIDRKTRAVIGELGGDAAAAGGEWRVSKWREEWLGHDRHLVPMLVLPDGHVSRGLGALARLAELMT